MHVFIPLEDSTRPAAGTPLVPYRCGLPFAFECVTEPPADPVQRWIARSSPTTTPSARARPPLSSST